MTKIISSHDANEYPCGINGDIVRGLGRKFWGLEGGFILKVST